MGSSPRANSLRILSIDGGGVKGYTALLILKRIFRTIQSEGDLPDEPKPCDVFDLIVGTSTGGLIAVMLGRLHMTVDECIQQYEILGSKIFGSKPIGGQAGRLVKGMLSSPFYQIGALQSAIKSVLKQRNVNEKETLWASATAAAPMYFKAVKFEAGGEAWCDGGLHRNNPIREALSEIGREAEWIEKSIGCLLSLGTGVPKLAEVSDNLAKFFKGSIDIMTDSEKIADEFVSSREGQELAASRRYFRFNVPQGMQELQMDEVKETDRMKALTTEYLSKYGSGNEVERCAKTLLSPDENLEAGVIQKPSLLPYNPCIHFVDRIFYNTALHAFFRTRAHRQQRFVLWGLGGAGKTQIALRYAHSTRWRLSVFWVRCDNLTKFVNDFTQIIDLFDSSSTHADRGHDKLSLARTVSARLEKDPNWWLLVLDNADDFESFVGKPNDENAISKFIPRNGRILITTRDPRFLGMVAAAEDGLHVEPMNLKEARDLFLKSISAHLANQTSSRAVDDLLDLLGNLPLAIAQAAANITDQQRPVQEYIAAYHDKRSRLSLMEKPALDFETLDPRTSSQSILVTWELSFERLEHSFPSSARCLNYSGFFYWRNIPRSLIRALPDFEDVDLQSFRNIVKRLVHLSMIEEIAAEGESEFFVHPIVHERISERLTQEEKESYLGKSLHVVSSLFPNIQGYEEREHFALCQSLQPHAMLQIDFAISIEIKNRDLAHLTQLSARFLRLSGMTFKGLKLAAKALALAQDVWSDQSASKVHAWLDMIDCLIAGTCYQDAYNQTWSVMELLERAKTDMEALEGGEYLDLRARILHRRGQACWGLSRYDESEQISKELLASKSELTHNVLNDQVSRHNLANAFKNQGRLLEARALNCELLSSMDDDFKKTNKRFSLTAYTLKANILRSIRAGHGKVEALTLGDVDDRTILEIYQDVYEQYQETFPIGDLDLWKACNNVVGELWEKKRWQEAEKILLDMLERALESELRMEGQLLETFTVTLARGLLISGALQENGDPRRGPPGLRILQLLADILALAEIESMTLWQRPLLLSNFAVLLHRFGRWHEAESTLREALTDIHSQQNKWIETIVHYNLMLAIARQGRLAEARRYKDMHLALIGVEEKIHGELESRVRTDTEDKAIYDRAKRIIAGEESSVEEVWWIENARALNKTQIIYGRLEPSNIHVDPKPYQDIATGTKVHQENKTQRLTILGRSFRRKT